MNTGLTKNIAQHKFTDTKKTMEYVWQLEDELSDLRAEVKTLTRILERERVEITCLRSTNLLMKMTGF